MNTLKLFTAIIILLIFAGCSDNNFISNPPAHNKADSPNGIKGELIWERDEFIIFALNEQSVNDKLVYNNPHPGYGENYQAVFDVSTDADVIVNGYRPCVKISMNDIVVFECTEFLEMNPLGFSHKDVFVSNIRLTQLSMMLSLSKESLSMKGLNEKYCKLRLNNIKLYKYN